MFTYIGEHAFSMIKGIVFFFLSGKLYDFYLCGSI